VEVVEIPSDSASLTEHLDLDSDLDIDDDDEPSDHTADQVQLAKQLSAITHTPKRKITLSKEFRRARSNIHLLFDLWTSSDCYGMIAIVAHYIDRKGCRQTTLLAIRKLVGKHSGENIAASVCKVLKEYRIQKKVGFFILDNASVNGVAVDRIMSSLHPDMPEKQRKRRRLRCFNHITNLVAKAFLLGVKADETVNQLY
jgi:hypothetical protein